MTLVYTTGVLNSRLTVVANAIDSGGGGFLRLMTAANATLGLVPLSFPCSTVAGGVLTFSGLPIATTITAPGVFAKADLEDATNTLVASGLTIGVSSTFDIVVSQIFVNGGDIVTLNSATITGH